MHQNTLPITVNMNWKRPRRHAEHTNNNTGCSPRKQVYLGEIKDPFVYHVADTMVFMVSRLKPPQTGYVKR